MVRGKILIEDRVKTNTSYRIRGKSLEALLLWKPRVGLALTIVDKTGSLFRARCTTISTSEAELFVYEEMGTEMPTHEIILLQALPQRERMKLIIEKTTELGVSMIVPFVSQKSIKKEDLHLWQDKTHRWQDWALKAALQSRRAFLPVVEETMAFKDALSLYGASEKRLILSERHRSPHIKEVLRGWAGSSLVVVVGPEGGFTEEELLEAQRMGYIPVSTGHTILRTETAAIFAVAVAAYEAGGRR